MNRRIAMLAATGLIVAGCGGPPHPDCEVAGPGIAAQVARVSSEAPSRIYATPSRIAKGASFLSADTSHGVAIWGTTSDPQTTGTSGLVFAMNDAARADAVVEVGMDDGSLTNIAALERDEEGMDVARSCLEEGED